MSDPTSSLAAHAALAGMAYLLVKHAAADFVLQSRRQRQEKGIYGAVGGLQHSLIHVCLTLPVFFLLPPVAASTIAVIMAAEFLLHYHIDWSKEQIVRREGWTSHDAEFWWAIGFDQLLHGLTYIALLWLVFASG
jgi:hypothetical protein